MIRQCLHRMTSVTLPSIFNIATQVCYLTIKIFLKYWLTVTLWNHFWKQSECTTWTSLTTAIHWILITTTSWPTQTTMMKEPPQTAACPASSSFGASEPFSCHYSAWEFLITILLLTISHEAPVFKLHLWSQSLTSHHHFHTNKLRF